MADTGFFDQVAAVGNEVLDELRPDIDHVQPASRRGPTTQANGRLGCGHNRLRNTTKPDHAQSDLRGEHAGPNPPDG